MKKETKNKIKLFKAIKPEEEWKSDLRADLFGPPNILFTPISLNRALNGLALTAVIVFMVIFNTVNTNFEDLEMVPITRRHVKLEKEVTVTEIDRDEEVLNRLTTEVEIKSLSEKEKLKLAKESTQAILNEIKEMEESLIKVTATKK